MIINNYDLLTPLLNFSTYANSMYVLQIMTRKKDNEEEFQKGEGKQKHRIIKEYYIESLDYLDKKYEEIKMLCRVFNARAYINLNPIDKSQIGLNILEQVIIKMKNNDNNYLNVLSKALGSSKPLTKRWVVDIDSTDAINIEGVINYINSLRPTDYDKCICTVPTVHGIHIITMPFDLKAFKTKYKDIDVQKNNPTLIYYNNDSID